MALGFMFCVLKKKIITIITLILMVFVFAGIFDAFDAEEFAGIDVEPIGQKWKEIKDTKTKTSIDDANLLALILNKSPNCKIGDTITLETVHAIPNVTLTAKDVVKSNDRYFKPISVEKGDKFFTRFYYTMTVASTVGFGDIYPVSKRARIFTMLLQLIVTVGWITGFLQDFIQQKDAKESDTSKTSRNPKPFERQSSSKKLLEQK